MRRRKRSRRRRWRGWERTGWVRGILLVSLRSVEILLMCGEVRRFGGRRSRSKKPEERRILDASSRIDKLTFRPFPLQIQQPKPTSKPLSTLSSAIHLSSDSAGAPSRSFSTRRLNPFDGSSLSFTPLLARSRADLSLLRPFCRRIDELGVGNRKFFSATPQDIAERDRTRVWKEVGLRGVGEL